MNGCDKFKKPSPNSTHRSVQNSLTFLEIIYFIHQNFRYVRPLTSSFWVYATFSNPLSKPRMHCLKEWRCVLQQSLS